MIGGTARRCYCSPTLTHLPHEPHRQSGHNRNIELASHGRAPCPVVLRPLHHATRLASPPARANSTTCRPAAVAREGKTLLSRSSCTGMTRLCSPPTAFNMSALVNMRLDWLPTAKPIGTSCGSFLSSPVRLSYV